MEQPAPERYDEAMLNTRAISWLLMLVVTNCCFAPRGNAADGAIDFVRDIKPILSRRCILCHHSEALFGNLNLENRAHAFKNRPGGPAILPGRPDSSPLHYVLMLPPKDPKAMPPTGHRIPDKEEALLYRWIKEGALWPEGAAGVIEPVQVEKGR